MANVGIAEQNFLGKGQDVRLKFTLSERTNEIDASFTEPYLFEKNMAAGFDLLFIETAGVGQVELAVSAITDIVLLLLLPGTGDELQGMKRGTTEVADLILINKADGVMQHAAATTAADYHQAINVINRPWKNGDIVVSAVSALENYGIAEVLKQIMDLHDKLSKSGQVVARRADQAKGWLWRSIKETLEESILDKMTSTDSIQKLEEEIIDNRITGRLAARRFLDQYLRVGYGKTK